MILKEREHLGWADGDKAVLHPEMTYSKLE